MLPSVSLKAARRPAVSEKRLALTANRQVRYELKTPYRKSCPASVASVCICWGLKMVCSGLPRERSECFGYGTTQVIFEPQDVISKLTALVPKPRVNLN